MFNPYLGSGSHKLNGIQVHSLEAQYTLAEEDLSCLTMFTEADLEWFYKSAVAENVSTIVN